MRVISGAIICFATMLPTQSAAEDLWAVLPTQAQCFLDNLDAYLLEPGEPIVIFLRACPITDTSDAMQALQQNSSSLPRVTEAPDGTSLDDVIVYTRDELACLSEMLIDTEETPVLLPQTPCDP